MSVVLRLNIFNILNGLSFGVFLAVQGVVLIERGALEWHLGPILGILALVVVLAKVPLSTLSDRFGRIPVYRLSCLTALVATIVLLLSGSWFLLIAEALMVGFGVLSVLSGRTRPS